ncbi:hypothetical protein [Dinoroseobacter sp. S76]|uniref:hypothetical protein n=1 Tax=Dinoroseobacter sp. S76 TaxID=3415124 RepID=UPI003C7ED0D1
MKTLIAALAFTALGAIAPVHATVIKLTYSGNEYTGFPLFPGAEVFPIAPLSGHIVLDTSITGGFPGGTVDFATTSTTTPADLAALGILEWTFTIPIIPTVSTDASFTFDDAGDVSDWSFSTLDGPPDYFNTPSTDSIVVGDAEYIADPGSWSVAIIPLPASSALLLTTALSAFGVTRMRRKRKKAPLG